MRDADGVAKPGSLRGRPGFFVSFAGAGKRFAQLRTPSARA